MQKGLESMQKGLESMQKGLEDIKCAPFRCVAFAAKYNGTMGFCMVFDRYKSKIEGKRWGKNCVLQLYKGVF